MIVRKVSLSALFATLSACGNNVSVPSDVSISGASAETDSTGLSTMTLTGQYNAYELQSIDNALIGQGSDTYTVKITDIQISTYSDGSAQFSIMGDVITNTYEVPFTHTLTAAANEDTQKYTVILLADKDHKYDPKLEIRYELTLGGATPALKLIAATNEYAIADSSYITIGIQKQPENNFE